jgi:hypothetical protein
MTKFSTNWERCGKPGKDKDTQAASTRYMQFQSRRQPTQKRRKQEIVMLPLQLTPTMEIKR